MVLLVAFVEAQTPDPIEDPKGGANAAFCGGSGLNPFTDSSGLWGGTTGVKQLFVAPPDVIALTAGNTLWTDTYFKDTYALYA